MNVGEALGALQRGLVVGMPTDTVYGIGVDPFSEQAVARLFEVKGRSDEKAIPILAADTAALRLLADLTPEVEERAQRHWPGGLTLVVRRAASAPLWVGHPDRDTVAVRIPAHDTALELLRAAGPLAVTSANRSGEEPVTDDEQAARIFGRGVAVYLPGVSPGGSSSTVVDVTGPEPVVLRDGPVDWEDA